MDTAEQRKTPRKDPAKRNKSLEELAGKLQRRNIPAHKVLRVDAKEAIELLSSKYACVRHFRESKHYEKHGQIMRRITGTYVRYSPADPLEIKIDYEYAVNYEYV